ncbi:MAG: GNAT family N-acetyltransferase [Gammaproteobacteria bacterium]
MRIVQVTGPDRDIVAPELLAGAERVHRQLRPGMPQDYAARMASIFREGGQMCVALRDGRVVGVAVYRVFDNTHAGRRFYVDDLVTDEAQRSSGIGSVLLRHLEANARACGCAGIELESGSHRTGAHRFYFREGFVITGFSFKKELK